MCGLHFFFYKIVLKYIAELVYITNMIIDFIIFNLSSLFEKNRHNYYYLHNLFRLYAIKIYTMPHKKDGKT